ncbi:IniB N-terminal domain-containing protein [Mycobacterium sp. ACS4331]|uniref:IniB N-terminal domain-containing protein n=1 Tax=Mycobacterium sp. ACS4331 TaxID=1834121 RepID=UPI0007FEA358|nr:IniB N-terminal domain-containing protein [Mycobacterium sp. ACS4331]OBF12950.1 hypothetical protein A5727_01285 [Mycobacterium sp. ACS4331]
MINLIDWLLNLFRDEHAARAFVASPEATLRDAGLAGVSAAQLSSVAATAVPSLVLGGGDPVVGLQRAVSNHYGFAPAYDYSPSTNLLSPSPVFAPNTNTDLASHNNTDLASHNSTPIMSPNQDAGANAQQGAFNLGFGDITLGDKTSNTATNGGVVVGGENRGDIVSGDGAVLGNNNDVNNGDVWAGTGSNVTVGHGDIEDNGTTNTGSGSVIKDNDGPVFQDVDASGGSGGHAGGNSGGLIDVGLGGDHTQGGNGGGGGIVIVSNETATNTVGGNQSQVGGDSATNVGSGNSTSAYSQTETQTTTTVSDYSDHSQTEVYDNSSQHSASLFDNSHDTSAVASAVDTGHSASLGSGNDLF